MQHQRLVLLAGPGESTNILFNAIHRSYPFTKVIIEQPVPRIEFLKRRVKRLGLIKVTGQVLFQSLIVPLLRRTASDRICEIKAINQLNDAEIPADMVVKVDSANSDQTIDLLSQIRPDLVLINGTRILSSKLLGSIPARFVNIHAGITPSYRGVHGAYWALVENNRDACGVTVHFVDKGIDTGGILKQTLIYPTDSDNFTTYPYMQLAEGLKSLTSLLPDLLEGRENNVATRSGKSVLRTHPTIFEYLKHRSLSGVR